jgi:hypothetical protein
LIKEHGAELVYFSTTMFVTLALGRLWKKSLGTPYVIDLQDPWVGNYYEGKDKKDRPPKYAAARRMHKTLEAWTMAEVGGVIAVTDAYHSALRDRYPRIAERVCRTIPFGGASLDYQIAARAPLHNRHFSKGDGLVHGVYAGVLGRVMRGACADICLALRNGLARYPELFKNVRLHFIGTDYASGACASKTIEPIAAEMGVSDYVREETGRIPYFDTLRLLRDADFLLVPGSDDPHYTASKIYPYILAERPLLALFNEASSVVDVLRSTRAGEVVTFSGGGAGASDALLEHWVRMLQRLPFKPSTDWLAFEKYTAREMTRLQCELFDLVAGARRGGASEGVDDRT